MSNRVPGGRQRAASEGDILDGDEDIDDMTTDQRSTTEFRRNLYYYNDSPRTKQSLGDVPKHSETRYSGSDLLDKKTKKKKGYKKPFKSLSSFMHKVARTVSSSLAGNNVTDGEGNNSAALSPKRSGSMREKNHATSTWYDDNNTRQQYADLKSPKKSGGGGSSVYRSQSMPSSTRRPNVTVRQAKLKYPIVTIDDRVPGVEGIKNHGNTCFMNAVLQCLSHTDILAEYFVTDQYKTDLMLQDRANAKKFGSKGEVTEHLAILLKSLWSCQYYPEISSNFKAVVGKHGSQYRGYSQHDAQEFLLWLLDKVHEDLNTATKKKYRANKSSYGRPDDIVAAEALANHMRNNNSFVYDLFHALYRSSLICPCCHRESNTFDPFLCVSLPIPQKSYRPVFITVVYLDAQPKQVRIGLMMDCSCTIKELRRSLSEDTGIPMRQIVLCEIYYDGFHRTFRDDQPFTDIHETDNVFAIEVHKSYIDTLAPNQYPDNDYVILIIANKSGTGSQAKKFGPPLVLQLPRDTSFLQLQSKILSKIEQVSRPVITRENETSEHHLNTTVMVRLKVSDGITGKCYLPNDVECPLYMQTVDRALTYCANSGGPLHVKLTVEWEQQPKPGLFDRVVDHIEEHASVRTAKQAQLQPIVYTLDECFELYTQKEELGAEDAWMCPNCRKHQQGTIKKLNLWSLPDILVVHLKRFKQVGMRRTKLNSLISFPLDGLDMSQHVYRRDENSQLIQMYTTLSPWRRQRWTQPCDDDYMYDLYAVCNHYGNMLGGHYTAFTKNPADDKWYSFDDQKVQEIPETQIVTRTAYMLFYRRRTLTSFNPHENSSQLHWLTRMPPFQYKNPSKLISCSEENLLDEPAKSKDDSSLVKPTLNNFNRYASLPRRPKTGMNSSFRRADGVDSEPELSPRKSSARTSSGAESTADESIATPSNNLQSEYGLVVKLPPEKSHKEQTPEKSRPSSLSSGSHEGKIQKHVTICDDVFVNGERTPTKPPPMIDDMSPPVSTSSPQQKRSNKTLPASQTKSISVVDDENEMLGGVTPSLEMEVQVNKVTVCSEVQVVEPIPLMKSSKPVVAPKPVYAKPPPVTVSHVHSDGKPPKGTSAARSSHGKRTPSTTRKSEMTSNLNGFHPVLAAAFSTLKPVAHRNQSLRSTGSSSRSSSFADSSSSNSGSTGHSQLINGYADAATTHSMTIHEGPVLSGPPVNTTPATKPKPKTKPAVEIPAQNQPPSSYLTETCV